MSVAVLEAFVTNLGKYVGGELCGEWLKLPAKTEDVKALFAKIGVDGVVYEEFFITTYKTDIPGLCDRMGEYESIDELNYLATLLSDMDEWEMERFTAALEYGEYTSSAKDLINLTQNLDCYDYCPGVQNEEDLGYYLIDELCMLDIPENIQSYFDYEAYGRDVSLEDGGVFGADGYIVMGGGFTEQYSGREDIPDECRIFAFPDIEKMSMKDRFKLYQQMIPALAAADSRAPERPRAANAEL